MCFEFFYVLFFSHFLIDLVFLFLIVWRPKKRYNYNS